MRIVIQRVQRASVTIDNQLFSEIGAGLMILVGVREGDEPADMQWLAAKAANMRIFDDENGVMNRSVMDVDGEIKVASIAKVRDKEASEETPVSEKENETASEKTQE